MWMGLWDIGDWDETVAALKDEITWVIMGR